jgi:hypothetical protein
MPGRMMRDVRQMSRMSATVNEVPARIEAVWGESGALSE